MSRSPEEIAAVERSVYYRNCDAARAAGVAPIYAGSPGYRDTLDGDSDGIACEPYWGM
ncbi:excalibur calcium-binding domain-containing protein [Sphingobium nicotianae]|nr:excalibur calcium-binding domain-containing protein [Sphingobium nicotianae]